MLESSCNYWVNRVVCSSLRPLRSHIPWPHRSFSRYRKPQLHLWICWTWMMGGPLGPILLLLPPNLHHQAVTCFCWTWCKAQRSVTATCDLHIPSPQMAESLISFSHLEEWLMVFCSPNRFTCMGFLLSLTVLLWKGAMLGTHDFASVSGFAFLSVSHLLMTWNAWCQTCLPFIFHLSPTCWCLGTHDARLICFPFVSHLLQ